MGVFSIYIIVLELQQLLKENYEDFESLEM